VAGTAFMRSNIFLARRPCLPARNCQDTGEPSRPGTGSRKVLITARPLRLVTSQVHRGEAPAASEVGGRTQLSSPTIEQKLEQLYAALAEMRITDKLASMRPTRVDSGGRFAATFDFTKIEKPATAANRISTLVSNIASLKDHLHSWCRKTGKPETGDLLINSNRDVAIIHDLWNLDKHAELNRPSRSELSPRLQPARTTLEFKVTTSEETPLITIPVFGGPIQAHGDANVRITATVVARKAAMTRCGRDMTRTYSILGPSTRPYAPPLMPMAESPLKSHYR
jgi:hypothetical protein